MIDRLRKKFIRITMGSVIVVLLILMGAVNISNYCNIDRFPTERLQLLADNGGAFPGFGFPVPEGQTDAAQGAPAGEQTAPETLPDGQPGFAGHRNLSPETPYETRYFSVLLKEDGSLGTVNTGKIAAVTTEEAVSMARRLAETGRTSGYTGNYKYLAQRSESGTRYIFLDCTRDRTSARTFFRNSVLVSLGGIAAVFALVVILSRRAIRPIAESYDKQKQFITNAGHEIKTPLTIIDSCTEVLELEQGENKWTQGIRGQVRRLSELTGSLVSLARMDEGSQQLPMEEFDLSDAAADVLEPFSLLAEHSGLKLELEIQPGISFRGNEKTLRQLCSILADNAVKYARPGGVISISLKRKGRRVYLVSRNEADGLTKGGMDVIFDRFYRGDISRSSETGGCGIGLSMAQAIVTAHGGRISAVSEDGETLVITAQL